MIALVLALFTAEPLPAVPPLVHHRAPEWRTETTSYHCPDGDRSVTLRYRLHGFERVQAGVRKGIALSPAAIERATAALRRLDAVTTIVPECLEADDILMVLGRIGRQRVLVFLHWSGDDIRAEEPVPIGN